MVKGLRRVVGEGGRAVRRGIAPQALLRAMDACLDPDILEHAYMWASLSLALQAVRYIYRYHTGIAPFFDSFWSGMVKWYAKVVLIV